MKRKVVFISMLFNVLLISCDRDHRIVNDPYDDCDIMGMQIVQVSNVEYLNYVLVETLGGSGPRNTYTTPYYSIRDKGSVYQELYLGSIPYIHLVDDYYLVDWKWGSFVYEPYNTLLDIKWNEVTNRDQRWEIDFPIIEDDFIVSWGVTDRGKIDRYLNIQHSEFDPRINNPLIPIVWQYPWFMCSYLTISDLLDDMVTNNRISLDEYNNEVLKQDSLQQVYVERLSQIISEQALEQVAYLYHINKY